MKYDVEKCFLDPKPGLLGWRVESQFISGTLHFAEPCPLTKAGFNICISLPYIIEKTWNFQCTFRASGSLTADWPSRVQLLRIGKTTKTCVAPEARPPELWAFYKSFFFYKAFVKGSNIRWLQSNEHLNISNMVSNMTNLTMSPWTSQPLYKVIPLE